METTPGRNRRGQGEGLIENSSSISDLKIHDYEYLKMAFKKYKQSLEDLKTVQTINYLFYCHTIMGGFFPIFVTCLGGISIYPYIGIISMINLLLGLGLNGWRTILFSKKRLIWALVFFLGPHILGQPVNNLNAFKKSLNLSFYNFSIIGAYSKNDAISVMTILLSLAASIILVLDWMRWWQDYPLPIINAIALSHVITASYICL